MRAYISIGSNIGRETHIRSAVRMLGERYGPLTLSPVYESPPVGFDGENFYNLAAGFDSDTTVERLIGELHIIEQTHGRTRRGERFESRTLDLDLLLYGNLVRHDHTVDIPRGEITKYAFVLQPLADIAPESIHPELRQSLSALWHELRGKVSPVTRVEFDPLK